MMVTLQNALFAEFTMVCSRWNVNFANITISMTNIPIGNSSIAHQFMQRNEPFRWLIPSTVTPGDVRFVLRFLNWRVIKIHTEEVGDFLWPDVDGEHLQTVLSPVIILLCQVRNDVDQEYVQHCRRLDDSNSDGGPEGGPPLIRVLLVLLIVFPELLHQRLLLLFFVVRTPSLQEVLTGTVFLVAHVQLHVPETRKRQLN